MIKKLAAILALVFVAMTASPVFAASTSPVHLDLTGGYTNLGSNIAGLNGSANVISENAHIYGSPMSSVTLFGDVGLNQVVGITKTGLGLSNFASPSVNATTWDVGLGIRLNSTFSINASGGSELANVPAAKAPTVRYIGVSLTAHVF